MRLGAQAVELVEETRTREAYSEPVVAERHRHRYEVNNHFRPRLEEAGLVVSGTYQEGRLVEVIELQDHPWFVASQFHLRVQVPADEAGAALPRLRRRGVRAFSRPQQPAERAGLRLAQRLQIRINAFPTRAAGMGHGRGHEHKRLLVIAATALTVLVGAAPSSAAGPPNPQGALCRRQRRPRGSAYRGDQAGRGGGGTRWGKQLERSEGWFPCDAACTRAPSCGSQGVITYRSSSAWTSHDFSCWTTNGPHVAKTYGGAGWGMVEVQARAEVARHSPSYWPTWHDTLMMRVRYYPNGWYETVAWD